MGRIQSNVGLITGIPITDTINQLIGVASRPRDILTARTQGLQQQQVAVNTLASRVLSLKFDLDQLKVSDPFESQAVTSANEEVLTATILEGEQPPLGTFALRPARQATAQQFISQRFESVDDIPTIGSLTLSKGGYVDKGISLDELNDGTGVARGEIRITDRAGDSAVIDLSLIRTVDDVVEAINNESTISVTASTDGNHFVLTDTSGGTSNNLRVQEVNGGTTAAELGLAGINTTNTQADGTVVYQLHAETKLSTLNDGNGVRLSAAGVHDLVIQLSGETEAIEVDLTGSTTVGDVLEKINAASTDGDEENPQLRLNARVSDDGNRITIEDIRDPVGTITITSIVGSAATDLGIETSGGVAQIDGTRLVSGLRDTLVASLRGGTGVTLESINVTDRSGANATIDLSGAETLQGIVTAINAEAGVNIQASINDNRNGLTLTDTSGGNGNLIITNGPSGTTADDLGIVVDDSVESVNSGTLGRQSLSEATLLSSLNGGKGTSVGDVKITDSEGNAASFDFNKVGEEPTTIGDIIDAINNETAKTNTDFDVTARINDTGNGILLIDNANGNETLTVENVNGTLADDLNLTRSAETVDINGTDRQVIDGTSSDKVDLTGLEDTSDSITLASLNNGNGVELSDIRITNTQGQAISIDLNGQAGSIKTVTDLLDTINAAVNEIDVTASITSSGTGIQITDSAGGTGQLKVEDINGNLAAELGILNTSTTTTSISSSGIFDSRNTSQGALNNLASQINDLRAGVTASVFSDGKGFRLQISVDETGSDNEILLDESLSGFDFQEVTTAQDALLVVGEGATAGSGVLVSSSTNDFEDVVAGTSVTALKSSDTSVDLTVETSDQEIIDRVQAFVDAYNSLRDNLGELTSFNEDDLTTGLLFGTTEALRVDTALSRLVTDRYSGVGSFGSLQEVGIKVGEDGKLSLDSSQLKDAFENDAASLESLFGAEERGVVARFNTAIEQLTDAENGLLTNRDNTLQATINANNARIERFNESLERQRARLELEFFQLESLIASLQSNQQALGAIQAIPPLSSTNRLGQ